MRCNSLTSATIPNSVDSIGFAAFSSCTNLAGVYFHGNAPIVALNSFEADTNATVYYLPGTLGWGPTFGGRPTALWIEVPTLLTSPQSQTAEAGATVCFRAGASNSLPLYYWWYFNGTNLLRCSTNNGLELTNVQFAHSGNYSVIISNALGAITSPPAMFNVIPPVERRLVPELYLLGEIGRLVNVDCADSLSPAPNWNRLDTISLTTTNERYFDVSTPLPPRRFYRGSQTGATNLTLSLNPQMIPALTLTGSVSDSIRVDGINQFGPIDAWSTLDTVTLTNTSQLYFDVSTPEQPRRLYRLVPLP
jgi:hypothetical protein